MKFVTSENNSFEALEVHWGSLSEMTCDHGCGWGLRSQRALNRPFPGL